MLTRKLTYAALLMSLACTSRAQPSEVVPSDKRPAKVEPRAEPLPSTTDAGVHASPGAQVEPTFTPGRFLIPGRISRSFYEVLLCPDGAIHVQEEKKRQRGTYEREGTTLHVMLGKKKLTYELKPDFQMLRGPAGKWLTRSGPPEGCEGLKSPA